MSFNTPNGKRRRLEQASSALSKPFKSPLRRDTPAPAVKQEASSPSLDKLATAKSSQQSEIPSSTRESSYSSAATSRSALSLPTPPPTRKRTLLGVGRPIPSRPSATADPEITALQKQQRELQSRLSTFRSELDTVQQALRIESSNRHEELETLISKWKKVSQDAAEDVFTGAQERMSRMGGVKAWREKMKSDDTRWGQEEMESWFGNVDGRDLEFDQDEIRLRREEVRQEMERAREKNGREEEEAEAESEEFTMDMMLKTLNIELATVGYDKDGQRWIKE
ncbi:putative DNA repair protein Dds20/Mei5 [Aspergillus stella-maris]|uniref:putative DNA repair protein Dds20/Mei5 n=1 Tax=Aspergillus stella-maris TaxID=1810926 RepID=UPI003CCD0C63